MASSYDLWLEPEWVSAPEQADTDDGDDRNDAEGARDEHAADALLESSWDDPLALDAGRPDVWAA